MFRRWLYGTLAAVFLLLPATLVLAQIATIPTDPLGSRGAAILCYNAGVGAWQPCSALNPVPTTPAGPVATQDVNVLQWGTVNTTLGQKVMGSSVPVTVASDQPPFSITGTLTTVPGTPTGPTLVPGSNWFRSNPGPAAGATFVTWLSPYTAIACTDGPGFPAPVWRTNNRGRTWTNIASPSNLTYCTGITSQGNIVLISGSDPTDAQNSIWRSTNSGTTWTRVQASVAGGFIQSVIGLAGSTAITAGAGGINRSNNYGAAGSWTRVTLVSTSAEFNGHAIRLSDNLTWLMPQGTTNGLMRSIDDGLNWTSAVLGPLPCGPGLAVFNDNLIFAVGCNANLYKSVDKGATWTNPWSFPATARGIVAIPPSTLVVGLSDGRVWRSVDQGVTWYDAGNSVSAIGCNGVGTACIGDMAANTFGEIIANDSPGGGGMNISYSPQPMPGDFFLISREGYTLALDSAGRITASQGLANTQANRWPVFLSDGSAERGISTNTLGQSPVQGATLFNSSTTGAANTPVVATITGAGSVRTHLYGVAAYCSAGTASLTVQDGATTIWQTPTTAIGTTLTSTVWPVGLTASTGNSLVVTLGACGGGNTGTLSVQADRF